MKAKEKAFRMLAMTLLVLVGVLVGCAREGSDPFAPLTSEQAVGGISILSRTVNSPSLSGSDPVVVTFTVTPEEGGRGEADFVSFEVGPNAVKSETEITIRIEDQGLYLVELSADKNVNLTKGSLRIHVNSRDVDNNDINGDLAEINVYRQNGGGKWVQVQASYDQGSGNIVVNANKLSRYALSRE